MTNTINKINTIHIFPSSALDSISPDIKQKWMVAYEGKPVISWTYDKCYDFVQDKYPEIYENNHEIYEDGGLSKYFDPKNEAFNQDYIMIIARFMVAFYYGGIMVSSIENITPSLVEDNLNSEHEKPHIFYDTSFNSPKCAMIHIMYAPIIGDNFWLEIINKIDERKNIGFNESTGITETEHVMALDILYELARQKAIPIEISLGEIAGFQNLEQTTLKKEQQTKLLNTILLSIGAIAATGIIVKKLKYLK